ncbi:hypothetical protein LHJ74_07570 [Streptomyces sp. N2-109]|uniref:AG1 protein n=1 Tax=Streptomyces gossypii TaxID=2883101 RepID=A0ABT2JPG8_9ACTN|nr:hypothetical protein [Streptomyces gossypii]MCT2589777.1 hypothetical protein [Streptomyces gossypii]
MTDVSGAGESTVHTQLNEIPAPRGGGDNSGDLSVRDDELGKLGNMAFELHGRLSNDGKHAEEATRVAKSWLTEDGMDTGSALGELQSAWETKLGTLQEACAHISNHLDFSLKAHKQDEETIETGMRNAEGKLMTVSRISEYIN